MKKSEGSHKEDVEEAGAHHTDNSKEMLKGQVH